MRRWQRRIWISSVVGMASLLIVLGVLVGLFRLAVQLAPGYRAEVQAQVSELLNSPVRIGGMDLVWRGLYPTLRLTDVRVGDARSGALGLDSLSLGFSVGRLLRADFTPGRVRLRGTRLALRYQDDRFQLLGLSQQQESQAPPQQFLDALLAIGDIELRDARILWHDLAHDRPPRLLDLRELRATEAAAGMQIEAQVGLAGRPGTGVQLTAALMERPWRLQRLDLRVDDFMPWDDVRGWLPAAPALQGQLRELQLRSHWQDGRWRDLQADFDWAGLGPAEAEEPWRRWQGTLNLTREGDALALQVDSQTLETAEGRWPPAVAALRWVPGEADGQFQGRASYLRLSDLGVWAQLLPAPWLARWQQARPHGELRDVVWHWGMQADKSLIAQLDRVGVLAGDSWPGLQGLSGQLSLDANGGRMQIQSRDLVFRAPEVFAEPLPVDTLSGAVTWRRAADGWQLDAPGLHYAALSLDGVGRLALTLGERPEMDLDLSFFCPEPVPWLTYAPQFWHPNLRRWLVTAVKDAQVASGEVRYQGSLRGAAVREALDVELALERVNFAFAPDWPALQLPQAQLSIANGQLQVETPQGGFADLAVGPTRAWLELGRSPVVNVDAKLSGDAAEAWRVLGASHLRRRMGETLDAIDLAGRAEVDLRLELPLNNLDQTRYAADVELRRAALWTRVWPEPIKGITGALNISPDGLRGRALQAELGGLTHTVNLRPEAGVTHIEATTQLDPSRVVEAFPIPPWLARRASGESEWRLELAVGAGASPDLNIHSNLLGTAFDLPPPLGKGADDLRRLQLTISPGAPSRIHVKYADLLGFDALLSDDPAALQAARLHFGGDAAPAGAPGLWIEGQLAQTQLSPWIDLIGDIVTDGSAGGPAPAFGGMVVSVGELQAVGQRLRNTRLQLVQQDDRWRVDLSGPQTRGYLAFAPPLAGERIRLSGEFQHLDWTMTPGESSDAPLDPRNLPGLDIAVEQFSLNDIQLGEARLALEPIARGVNLDVLRVGPAEEAEFELQGLWLRDDAGSSAAMEFAAETSRFRQWLAALGYQRSLEAERAVLSGELSWSPHPDGLLPEQLDGGLSFAFNQGKLSNVEPGAGRILGLFSVNALPRRFFLDFRDVVDTGLGFDRLSGQFNLQDGVASTDDLLLEGPSLRIAARGDVSLVERSYDQTITVYPGLSGGVTLAATVLGGPAVGLFLMFAQELLDKPLDQVTQISYRLGGNWDNPQVERLQ